MLDIYAIGAFVTGFVTVVALLIKLMELADVPAPMLVQPIVPNPLRPRTTPANSVCIWCGGRTPHTPCGGCGGHTEGLPQRASKRAMLVENLIPALVCSPVETFGE